MGNYCFDGFYQGEDKLYHNKFTFCDHSIQVVKFQNTHFFVDLKDLKNGYKGAEVFFLRNHYLHFGDYYRFKDNRKLGPVKVVNKSLLLEFGVLPTGSWNDQVSGEIILAMSDAEKKQVEKNFKEAACYGDKKSSHWSKLVIPGTKKPWFVCHYMNENFYNKPFDSVEVMDNDGKVVASGGGFRGNLHSLKLYKGNAYFVYQTIVPYAERVVTEVTLLKPGSVKQVALLEWDRMPPTG